MNHGFPTASLGAGAKAGQDYVTNLRPSNAARQYFAGIPTTTPIETLTPANAAGSNSGVRFVANDGILIPAGVVIQFNNKGYCMDPKLPAPVGDDEYQFVPTTALIPSELQEMYSNLVRRAATGDSAVVSNMQRLIWALRTVGTDASYANNLSSAQKQLLNSCSTRSGVFDSIHQRAKQQAELTNKFWNMADKAISFNLGNRTYRASNFKNMGAINTVLNSELDNLVNLGKKLPIQRTGFNFGELQPGIYTDIRGTGTLSFQAKIANASKQDYIFYPCNYVGQVGSGSALSTFSFAAAANTTQRQRVTMGPIREVNIIAKNAPTIDTTTDSPTGQNQKKVQPPPPDAQCTATGKKEISNLNDIKQAFINNGQFNKLEQAGYYYYENGKWYMTDLCNVSATGGIVLNGNRDTETGLVHSHPAPHILGPGKPSISVESIIEVIITDEIKTVRDCDTQKNILLSPAQAKKYWADIVNRYNQKTSIQPLPADIRTLSEKNRGIAADNIKAVLGKDGSEPVFSNYDLQAATEQPVVAYDIETDTFHVIKPAKAQEILKKNPNAIYKFDDSTKVTSLNDLK